MALTVYTSKDNAWREYVNPLRGMTLERILQLIEQGLMVAVEQRRVIWPAGGEKRDKRGKRVRRVKQRSED
jgi:hypothetical protein